jgi:hypothetical protein
VDGPPAADGVPPIPDAGAALEAPAPPVPAFESAGTGGLGSLAQSARSKELKGARMIMFFVGGLTLLVNGFQLANIQSEVRDAMVVAERTFDARVAQEIQRIQSTPGMTVDHDRVAELRAQALATARREVDRAAGAAKLFYGFGILTGIAFIFCGLFVYQQPVAATVTALALYLAGNAIFGLLDHAQLMKGLLIKILIIGGLFKAVQAALAYQKEQAVAPARAA